MRRFTLIALASLGALALSACGKKAEETPEVVNNLVEPPDDIEVVNETLPPGLVLNTPEPAAPPVIGEDQQTLDDADATGMTARLPASDGEPVEESGNHSGHE